MCAAGPDRHGTDQVEGGSGVDIDVRRDEPYAAYGELYWDVVTTSNGDVFDKAVVILGNRDHAEMRHAVLWQVMDPIPFAS